MEAFIDNSRSLTAKERSEINAFVFSFSINSDEEKELDTDTFEKRAFRSAFKLDAIINDWNDLYHITTENELNAQIDIQTAIESVERKVTKAMRPRAADTKAIRFAACRKTKGLPACTLIKTAIAQKDSDKIKFALMQLFYNT